MHGLQEKLIAMISISEPEQEPRESHGPGTCPVKTRLSCYVMRLPARPSWARLITEYPGTSLHGWEYSAGEHVVKAGSPPASLHQLWLSQQWKLACIWSCFQEMEERPRRTLSS